MVQRIPNYLTFLRLGLIPIFVLLMVDPSPAMLKIAIAVFVVAACTDYVDGFLARKFGAVSDIGKLLDPLADKMLVAAALIMMVAQRSDSGQPWVPGWLVVLIMLREIWVTGLRGVAASRGKVVAASSGGKLKSGFQMVAIVFLMLHDSSFRFAGLVIPCQYFGLVLLSISLVFSYWAAGEYTYDILVSTEGRGAVHEQLGRGVDSVGPNT